MVAAYVAVIILPVMHLQNLFLYSLLNKLIISFIVPQLMELILIQMTGLVLLMGKPV